MEDYDRRTAAKPDLAAEARRVATAVSMLKSVEDVLKNPNQERLRGTPAPTAATNSINAAIEVLQQVLAELKRA